MKFRGYFSTCAEQKFTGKDGGEYKKIKLEFQIDGESKPMPICLNRDKSSVDWCKSHGVHTNAVGEVVVSYYANEYDSVKFYLQSFIPAVIEETNDQEPEQPRRQEQKVNTPEEQAVADNMVQTAQNDPEAGEKLPF